MKAAETEADLLQEHMTSTYHNLRLGIGFIGIALPLILWLGGKFLDHEPLRSSMSAYYYSPTMRNVFVGALVTIGVCSYLYKGFSTQENWVLNAAGALAIGVAMLPTNSPQSEVATLTSMFHFIFAGLFFACIIYVCVFRASDTLSLIRDTRKAENYERAYKALAIGMASFVVLAIVIYLLQLGTFWRPWLFFVEAGTVWIFAAYWLVKSKEMRATGAERLALEAKLKAALDTKAQAAPGRLVQIEP